MTNIKKRFLITNFIIILICIITTSIYASSTGDHVPVRLGLKLKHGQGTSESNYSIYVNQASTTTNPIVIFKIDIPDGNFQYALHKTIYCLKAGPGFGLDNWTKEEAQYLTEEPNYTEQFDLKKALLDRTEVETPYDQYILTIGSDNYKKLLYALDNMYAPEAVNAQTIRKNLLYKAGLYTPAKGETPENITPLTDADIDVIQQCVIWYFTNSTEADYHAETINLSLGTALAGTFNKLSDTNAKRATDAQTLYSYLIHSAQTYYQNYNVSMQTNGNASTRPPIELANTEVSVEKVNGKYIVGPYRIEKYTDMYYEPTLSLTNNGNPVSSVIKVKDTNGKYQLATQTSEFLLHDLEGKDFYFEIADVNDLQNLKLSISGSYAQSKVIYLSTNKDKDDLDQEQPLAVIEKFETPFTYEKIIQYGEFDLALRKFITNIQGTEITNRIPEFTNEGGTYTYKHTKEPEEVEYGNIITYTIRVYNEGSRPGYAALIKDDIPEGLTFLPEHATNTEYRWKMLDAAGNETTEIAKAVSIVSDYLSKEQGEANERNNLLQAFKDRTSPDFKDVKVAFQVTYQIQKPEDKGKILINKAQIAEDTDEDGNPVDDKDSKPDEWNEGEDDQDIEKVKVKYFDLSLRKWVTQAYVTEKGKTTIIDSGHTAEDDPEEIFKIDLNRKKIQNTTVKFKYSIRVKNEGEIAGYATEIKDHIPAGLKFVAEDNPLWSKVDNNTIVTDQLKDTLLQPNETATVEVILTWINGEETLGVHRNIAEISKDDNESKTPDIDSTPDNNKEEEDDEDDAKTIITIISGETPMYIGLSITVTTMLAGSLFAIRKYVL